MDVSVSPPEHEYTGIPLIMRTAEENKTEVSPWSKEAFTDTARARKAIDIEEQYFAAQKKLKSQQKLISDGIRSETDQQVLASIDVAQKRINQTTIGFEEETRNLALTKADARAKAYGYPDFESMPDSVTKNEITEAVRGVVEELLKQERARRPSPPSS